MMERRRITAAIGYLLTRAAGAPSLERGRLNRIINAMFRYRRELPQ